jgi:protein-S-isoprenylcysteine O-methyltransferase Ste14
MSDGRNTSMAVKIVFAVLQLVAVIAVWFWIAGRLDWIQAWVFLVVFVVYVSLLVWRVSRIDPDLMHERQQRAENVEPWDLAVMGVYLAFLVVLLVVSALDAGRFRWSAVPFWVQALGWGLICASGAILWHVMGVNAYLSSYARLQEERGQTVVRDGLYGLVRHPMYAGIVLAFLGLPLVLGSWWALIPGLLIDVVFVYRTLREDRMLQEGLEGYAEYAEEVRYRLFPGVW